MQRVRAEKKEKKKAGQSKAERIERLKPHGFQKGHPRVGGARKGLKYAATRKVREALLNAMEMVGSDNKGKNGLNGYFAMVAWKKPQVFCRLVETLMPMQVEGKVVVDKEGVYETREALMNAFAARGLPAPPRLIDITPVAVKMIPVADDDEVE